MKKVKGMQQILAVLIVAAMMLEPLGSGLSVYAAEPETVQGIESAETDVIFEEDESGDEAAPENETGKSVVEDDIITESTEQDSAEGINDFAELTDDIASGTIDETYGQIEWVIDKNGKLTVTGTGDFADPDDWRVDYDIPWRSYMSDIRSAEINLSGMKCDHIPFHFSECDNLVSVDFSNFDTSNVIGMIDVFAECENLTTINFGKKGETKFDTSNVTDMFGMFRSCRSLTSLDLSCFDTSKVWEMPEMFMGCSSLESLDLSSFDTSNVTGIRFMIHGCSNLTSLNVSSFNTSKVIDIQDMITYCEKLKSLDLSGFDLSATDEKEGRFDLGGNNSLELLYTPYNNPYDISLPIEEGSGDVWYDVNGNAVTVIPSGTKTSYVLAKNKIPEVQADDIASGTIDETYGQIEWVIDKNGKLTVTGTGDFADPADESNYDIPWGSYVSDIRSVEINLSGMKCSYIPFDFSEYDNLVSVDFSNFDTSNVIGMVSPFRGCSSLTTINFGKKGETKFDTSNMTELHDAFNGCESLTSLDLSCFDTSNATCMCSMFMGCSSLESLDLSNFDTSNVTDMSFMFHECSNLKSLNVSSFNTSKVTEIQDMITLCENLKNLDLSGFDLSATGEHGGYGDFGIYGNKSLELLYTPYNNPCDIELPIEEGSGDVWYDVNGNAVTVIPSGTKTSYVLAKNKIPEVQADDIASGTINETYGQIDWVIDKNGKLTVTGTGDFADPSLSYTNALETRAPWHSYYKDILSAEVQVSGMTNASGMFWGCNKLTDIDLRGFDTSSVTSMSYMFASCESLTGLNLSTFDTTKVTDMSGMFCACEKLSNLELGEVNKSKFVTSNVTDMSYMFGVCNNLTSLDLSRFDTSNVINMESMFGMCENLTDIDFGEKDQTLFVTSKVKNMQSMFGDCSSLISLDLRNFDMSNVINVSRMFEGCENLTDINFGEEKQTLFNTSKMENMGFMFSGCSSLKSLDLSGFDTSNVINMEVMFGLCSSLLQLDLRNFDTSKVANMNNMFCFCTNLKSLNLSNFDMSNVTDTESMFSGCDNLELVHTPYNNPYDISLPIEEGSGDVWYDVNGNAVTVIPSGTKTSYVLAKNKIPEVQADDIASGTINETYGQIEWVIDKNGKLTVTGTGDFADPAEAESASRAPWYDHRDKIKSAEVKVSGTTNARYMFCGCDQLTSVDVSGFDTSKVTDMYAMFYNCGLTSINFGEKGTTKFDTSRVTDMAYMFGFCENLTDLDVSVFDTSNVTNMEGIFMFCSCLTSLDLRNFDTAKVTNMQSMFDVCTNLTEVKFGGKFDTSNVTSMHYMFCRCENLLSIDASHFNTAKVTEMDSMFDNCSSLTSLDVSNFDTSKVKNMFRMFDGCRSLVSLNVHNFDTRNVKDMSFMFSFCESLPDLDVSSFDTSCVLNVEDMFSNCSQLKQLDLSGFDLSNVVYDSIYNDTQGFIEMFSDCAALELLYTPSNSKFAIKLPKKTGNGQADVWYYSDGTEAEYIPANMAYSVALKRNGIPTEKDADFCIGTTVIGTGCSQGRIRLTVNGNTIGNTDVVYSFVGYTGETAATTDENGYLTLQSPELTYDKNGHNNYTFTAEIKYKVNGSFVETPITRIMKVTVKCNGIACGEYGNTTWNIDDAGKLTVTGSGDYLDVSHKLSNSLVDIPWWSYAKCIKSAEVNLTGVTDTSYMFAECSNLTDVDFSHFDTSQVTNMKGMFGFCSSLEKLDLSGFDTSKVTCARGMFDDCSSLKELDLSSFDQMANGMDTDYWMFDYCISLELLYTPRNCKTDVFLPTFEYDYSEGWWENSKDTWYRSDGTIVKMLPKNLPYSVALGKNKIPQEKPAKEPDDLQEEEGVLPEDIPSSGEIPEKPWSATVKDVVYTGSAVKPEIHVYNGNVRLREGTDYSVSYKNNTNAYELTENEKDFNASAAPTIIVKGKGNYAGSQTRYFRIIKKNISDEDVEKTFTDAYAVPAKGNLSLAFTLKFGKKALKKDADYTMEVYNADENGVKKEKTDSYGTAGKYVLTVSGAKNYAGTIDLPFTVEAAKIPVSKLKIGKIAAVSCDASETDRKPKPEIKDGSKKLNEGDDYKLSWENYDKVGTATLTIEGQGHYAGSRSVTYTINGWSMKKVNINDFKSSMIYTGKALTQSAELSYNGKPLVKGSVDGSDGDYGVTYTANVNAGKATVTYTGRGNYTGTVTKTFKITAYNMANDTGRLYLDEASIVEEYAKGGAKPSVKIYDNGKLLKAEKDYTLSYKYNSAVTSVSTKNKPLIIIKGKGNYSGTLKQTKEFTITAKNLSKVQITAPDVTENSQKGKYKSTPVLTDTDGKNLKAKTDYSNVYSYFYASAATVKNKGADKQREIGNAVDENDIVPAGTLLRVEVSPKDGSNYCGDPVSTTYRVTEASISGAKVTVANPENDNRNLFIYTGKEITIDQNCLTVKVGREELTKGQYEILADTYSNNIKKGTASVMIKGLGKYGGTKKVTFKIGTKSF